MIVERDFKVTGKQLKGKAKEPTVTLESGNGEKLTLKLEDPLHLESFSFNQAFTVKLCKTSQQPLNPFLAQKDSEAEEPEVEEEPDILALEEKQS